MISFSAPSAFSAHNAPRFPLFYYKAGIVLQRLLGVSSIRLGSLERCPALSIGRRAVEKTDRLPLRNLPLRK
jgi:hypothetical protein